LSPLKYALTPAGFACGAGHVFDLWFSYAARRSSFCRSFSCVCYPTWSRGREWSNPNALRSHITTQMTTTAFKIDLMELAIGMNWFTNHRRTPTTIRANRIWVRGMIFSPFCLCYETLLSKPPKYSTNYLLRNAWWTALLQRRTSLSNQTGWAGNVLFDVLSAPAGRIDQAERVGLANTTTLFLQDNPRLHPDTRLFDCIQLRSLFAQRLSAIKSTNGPRQYAFSSDRGRGGLYAIYGILENGETW